eukprot:TRINITY_DN33835_c0_g1_i1.p1 TRINITY_DN33835_c0_g1~~TRINITY_DN33835_c0_g1_i1.p1  ORF type:complete len:468 (-),score=83.25 TRINITY_DN33835_c0_g1_i1:195-1598(-)
MALRTPGYEHEGAESGATGSRLESPNLRSAGVVVAAVAAAGCALAPALAAASPERRRRAVTQLRSALAVHAVAWTWFSAWSLFRSSGNDAGAIAELRSCWWRFTGAYAAILALLKVPRFAAGCVVGALAARFFDAFGKKDGTKKAKTLPMALMPSVTRVARVDKVKRDHAVLATADQIRAAEDKGRVLEAQRLLNAFGNDAGVAEAARIRSLAAVAEETIEGLEMARAAACDPGSGWQQKDESGIQLIYRYDWSTGSVEAVGSAVVDIPPLMLWALFREWDLSFEWLQGCLQSHHLAKITEETDMYHMVNKALLPVLSPTESILIRNYVDVLDEHGALVIIGNAPDENETSYQGVDLPLPEKGRRRVMSTVRNVLRPISDAQSMFVVRIKVDTPFRYLPSAIIGTVVSLAVKRFMSGISRAWDNWDSSSIGNRVKSAARAEYYAELKVRIDEEVARRKLSSDSKVAA